MSTDTQTTQYSFQAEIRQLLQLLSHSLYQNREITIRELISNASDALDKYRFQQLSSGSTDYSGLRIDIEPDKEARVLVIRDNGIGMTREELIANLGTIARSGSLEFLQQAQKQQGEGTPDLSLIGKFGVGFYSAFMLADRVEVLSRSATQDAGWRWESTGDGNFTITPSESALERGTAIRLHLKEGLDEFTDPVRLKYIIRKYSTFVPHPIHLQNEHINDQPPIWLEPKSSVSDEQYQSFFEYLTNYPGQKPIWHLHLSADSPLQFHSILYCPDTNFERMGFGRTDHGLNLCARRILVQNDNRDLLPDYLRFLRGIVDSADLPLNVSREALQDNTIFRRMQRVITKKVLDHLDSLAADNRDVYEKFYREFGVIFREGVNNSDGNKDRIAALLRFNSTTSSGTSQLVSLNEYCDRAPEAQEQIYYACGTDQSSVLRDPNLEVFRKRNLEVLVLTDPADEYVLSALGTFRNKSILSIDAADLKLPAPPADEKSEDKTAAEQEKAAPQGFDRLLEIFKETLGEQVQDVRKSERLTDSVCCLVNAEGSMSTTMQRILRMNTPDFEIRRMILEINPAAPLIGRLAALAENPDQLGFIQDCSRQLHANAMIQAGLAPDGNEMASRLQKFMLQLAERL